MRNFIILILSFFVSGAASAQSDMRNVLINMPDSLHPYLNENMRTELCDYYKMGVTASVDNSLGETTVLEELTDTNAILQLNAKVRLSINVLHRSDSTNIICTIKTYKSSVEESEISFYDINWNSINNDFGLPKDIMSGVSPDFFLKDSLSEEDKLIVEKMEPFMVKAEFLPQNIIVITPQCPLLENDLKKKTNAVFEQKKFKWNGEMLKNIR